MVLIMLMVRSRSFQLDLLLIVKVLLKSQLARKLPTASKPPRLVILSDYTTQFRVTDSKLTAVNPPAGPPEELATPAPGSDAVAGDDVSRPKKRKGADGGEASNDMHQAYLIQKQANLKLQSENLQLRGLLDDKATTHARLRIKNEEEKQKADENKAEHHRVQARLRDELARIRADHVKVVGAYLEEINKLKAQLLNVKVNDNDLRQEINNRDLRIKQLNDLVEHYSRAYAPAPPKKHEPTLVPHIDRKVRTHPEYKHPEAPHKDNTYQWFTSRLQYGPDSGKVYVNKYGSNKHWDLGLCRVRFVLGRECHVHGCEYRHEPLNTDEQIYINFLEPEGPAFLQLVATRNVNDRKKALI